jgi:hypothetical protein
MRWNQEESTLDPGFCHASPLVEEGQHGFVELAFGTHGGKVANLESHHISRLWET